MKDNMAPEYFFREFTENQQRTLESAVAAYRAYLEAVRAGRPFTGGMHWKKIKGREYLYRYRDRAGHGSSLGPRTPETEELFDEFSRRRRDQAAQLDTRRQQLAEAARFCRAALIHRVPDPVVRILRHLAPGDPAGAPLLVIDVHALHAFEFAAGVFIGAPREAPFWSGAASGLTLASSALMAPEELLRLLRRADRSYQSVPGLGLAAVNQRGFGVRCLGPPAVRAGRREAPGLTVPAELGDLAALLAAPKFSQVVIGRGGDPVTMVAPDPRALALNLLWRSVQEDREPADQERDRTRAAALAELILRYLPQYYFFSAELRLFPARVARLADDLVEGYEVAPDLSTDP
jgi:Nucleotidyltransferase